MRFILCGEMDVADNLLNQIKEEIKKTDLSVRFSIKGEIVRLYDGVAIVSGLGDVGFNEIVKFSNNTKGLVLDLGREYVGVLILGGMSGLKIGDYAESTGEVFSIPLGEEYLGRVVDGFGIPIDGLSNFMKNKAKSTLDIHLKDHEKFHKNTFPVEKLAPGIMDRKPVNRPLETGIKAIDTMVPIGRGQRELIIGDRQTGKTSIVLDLFLNQKDTDIICIYVAIGQKNSKVRQIMQMMKEQGIMDKCIIVDASSSSATVMQYLAPYVGCRIGEYFRDRGQDVIIAYDDLTKHAIAYREISLLLRRPPAREAYPGDIFYLHSRLLERASQLSDELGGGSLTAFPIVETLDGDISAYIPTNIISITDGQIFLDTDLFSAGIRPAIDAGLSVSRVGGSAQSPLMKRLASKLRLQLASFRELAKFLQFGSDLDEETTQQIKKGQILTEIMKQNKYSPMPIYQQIVVLYAGVNDFLTKMDVEKIGEWEKSIILTLETDYPELIKKLKDAESFTPELEKELKKLIKDSL